MAKQKRIEALSLQEAEQTVKDIFTQALSQVEVDTDLEQVDPVSYVKSRLHKALFNNQIDIVRSLWDRSIRLMDIICARQTGKSMGARIGVICAAEQNLYPTLEGFTQIGWYANKEEQSVGIGGQGCWRLLEENHERFKYTWDKAGSTKTHLAFKREAGLNTKLVGSIDFRTANPKAFSEGTSYSLMIVDEANRLANTVWSEVLLPMGGAHNAKIVKIGVPRLKNHFYETAFDPNYYHIRYDWTQCELYYASAPCELINPITKQVTKYGLFPIQRMPLSLKRRYFPDNDILHILPSTTGQKEEWKRVWDYLGDMGEDDFRTQYCVAPHTRILTADLHHIRADQVTVGMKLAGFDENRPGKGLHHNFQLSEVEAVEQIMRPCYKLTLSDGTEVTCSSEHRWLVSQSGGGHVCWRPTEDLIPTDKIFKVTEVWETNNSYQAGYLAGVFDGEACLGIGKGTWNLSFAQNPGVVLENVKHFLTKLGYQYRIEPISGVCNTKQLVIEGGRAEILRFLGQIRPYRLLTKFDISKLGSIGRHDRKSGGFEHPHVVKKEFLGNRKVVAMRTSTRTFVAEGLASHNCLEWLIDVMLFLKEIEQRILFEQGAHEPLLRGMAGEWYTYGYDPCGEQAIEGVPDKTKKAHGALSIWRRNSDGTKHKIFCDELESATPLAQVDWVTEMVHPTFGVFPCVAGCWDTTGLGISATNEAIRRGLPILAVNYSRVCEKTSKNWKNTIFDHFQLQVDQQRAFYPKNTEGLEKEYKVFRTHKDEWETVEKRSRSGVNADIRAPGDDLDDGPNSDCLAVYLADHFDEYRAQMGFRTRVKKGIVTSGVMGGGGFGRY